MAHVQSTSEESYSAGGTHTLALTGVTAGTIIPSLSLVTANAAVVKAGSYLAINRLGSASFAYSGRWD
jgi:hypothetical protein